MFNNILEQKRFITDVLLVMQSCESSLIIILFIFLRAFSILIKFL